MARIILKCPYLKGGSGKGAAHLNHLVKYIATRDGVERLSSKRELWHSTKKQSDLVSQIICEFPDAKNSLEYEDYLTNPNRENASEFISMTLEQHINRIGDAERYVKYIANRPRTEKNYNHGLFTVGEESIALSQVAKRLSMHEGNVWTPIISLRREDATSFGFENASAWKSLLASKSMEIANSLKIHPDHFKWYAAFHNESHHPHIHMICYSTNPKEGYLTKVGISKMKSSLAREIFKEELISLYGEKAQQRDELKEQTYISFNDLLKEMSIGALENEKIEELVLHLAKELRRTNGKKQYGYLKGELKNIVDEIVNELARDKRIDEAYTLWQEVKGKIDNIYSEEQSKVLPLARCEDFKSIRNMIIREALQIANETFIAEDSSLGAQAESLQWEGCSGGLSNNENPSWWTDEYKMAKRYFFGDECAGITQDFATAYNLLIIEAEQGNPLAMCDIGRMSVDGIGCEPNAEKSYEWYAKALATFHNVESETPWRYIEYRIGKMYAAGLGAEEDYETAASWLTMSADKKYMYAEYSLAGLYYHGNGIEQNEQTAFDLYTRSAKQGFPYASFELGKMCHDGIGCDKNMDKADKHFMKAFKGFLLLESQSKDDKLQYRLGWMILNGIGTEKNLEKAKVYLEKSATMGNQFAQYALGKLYLMGKGIPKDKESAVKWLTLSVEQGNIYAQFFLDHMDDFRRPSAMLVATRLLHHMSRIMGEVAPKRMLPNTQIDRKRLQKLKEKKQAQGHAKGDNDQNALI